MRHTRRGFFALLTSSAPLAAADACPVQVYVGEGLDLQVTVPNVRKADIVSLTASFLGREKQAPTKNLEAVLERARDISLTITTKCGVDTPKTKV